MLFAILKTKKLQANCNLRKIHKQFEQRNSGEQHKGRQRSDSAEPYADGFPKSTDQQSHVLTKNHLQCIRIQARFIGNSDNATPANSTKADSEAILPNRTQLVFLRATSLRENDFQRPAKGGSTPAFACQRAAIAPLPCPNLQLISYES